MPEQSRFIGLSKEFAFEAAHHLPNYIGKCASPHGHSYRVRVVLIAEVASQDRAGILVDFDVLKAAVHACILDRYDHKDLNQFFPAPTAERMVVKMFEDLTEWFAMNCANKTAKVYSVRLWETAKCWAEYRGPEDVAPW